MLLVELVVSWCYTEANAFDSSCILGQLILVRVTHGLMVNTLICQLEVIN